MGYWKSKVLPLLKKVFEKNGHKKAAAAEACKTFDDSKEEINKEFEEKKADLEPKVLGIYEASSVEIKSVVKDPTRAKVKKQTAGVNNFLEELVKIDFPGSKLVSEVSTKYGPAQVSGPVFFVFEKVATVIPAEAPPAAAGETTPKAEPPPPPSVMAEEGAPQEKIVVVEEAKREEVKEEDKTVPPIPSVVAVPLAVAKAPPEPVKPMEEPVKPVEEPVAEQLLAVALEPVRAAQELVTEQLPALASGIIKTGDDPAK